MKWTGEGGYWLTVISLTLRRYLFAAIRGYMALSLQIGAMKKTADWFASQKTTRALIHHICKCMRTDIG